MENNNIEQENIEQSEKTETINSSINNIDNLSVEKKKNNNSIFLIIIVIILIILGIGGYFIFNNIDNEELDNNIEETNINENNQGSYNSNEESSISNDKIEELEENFIDAKIETADGKIDEDTTTTGDISKKVSQILSFGTVSNTAYSLTSSLLNNNFNDTNTFNENINNNKNLIVLRLLNKDFKTLTETEKNIFKQKQNEDIIMYVGKIDKNLFEKTYKEIFNDKIIYKDIDYSCPAYKFDNEKILYYSIIYDGCGGIAPYLLIHKDSFVKEDNQIVAYISVANYWAGKIYKGINEDNYLYRKDLSNNDLIIKEIQENHDKYEKYRMIFQKDENNNYYFSSIEKVN